MPGRHLVPGGTSCFPAVHRLSRRGCPLAPNNFFFPCPCGIACKVCTQSFSNVRLPNIAHTMCLCVALTSSLLFRGCHNFVVAIIMFLATSTECWQRLQVPDKLEIFVFQVHPAFLQQRTNAGADCCFSACRRRPHFSNSRGLCRLLVSDLGHSLWLSLHCGSYFLHYTAQ